MSQAISEIEVGGQKFYYSRRDAFEQLQLVADFQVDFLSGLAGALTEEDIDAGIADSIRDLSMKADSKTIKKWCERLFDKDHLRVEEASGDVVFFNRSHWVKAFGDYTDILELVYRILMIEVAGPLLERLNQTGLGQKLKERSAEILSKDSLKELRKSS